MKKLHGVYRLMMEIMVKTAGKGLAEKEDRTPEEDDMLEILQPDVIVTQSFYIRDIQPDQGIIRRISASTISGAKRMYFTNIDRSLTDANPQLYSRCAGIGGHVVIRVSPGGKEYYVYMLDDSDTTYNVKQIDGPFRCKPQP